MKREREKSVEEKRKLKNALQKTKIHFKRRNLGIGTRLDRDS